MQYPIVSIFLKLQKTLTSLQTLAS